LEPENLLAENVGRLRSRLVSAKRSLALREFALGIEAFERFVRQAGVVQAMSVKSGCINFLHFGTFRNRYFRYLKRYHLYHHSPRGVEMGYGITSGIWDVVFPDRISKAGSQIALRKRLRHSHQEDDALRSFETFPREIQEAMTRKPNLEFRVRARFENQTTRRRPAYRRLSK
jgi:hypothetical protein